MFLKWCEKTYNVTIQINSFSEYILIIGLILIIIFAA